jgi:ankyrin repeat protein
VVKLLVDHGADVNAQTGEYSTALQAESEGGHVEVVNLLQNASIVNTALADG